MLLRLTEEERSRQLTRVSKSMLLKCHIETLKRDAGQAGEESSKRCFAASHLSETRPRSSPARVWELARKGRLWRARSRSTDGSTCGFYGGLHAGPQLDFTSSANHLRPLAASFELVSLHSLTSLLRDCYTRRYATRSSELQRRA